MKLASKLRFLAEKFDGLKAHISSYGSLTFKDATSVYTINLTRGSATKALLIFKGDLARMFEINMKVFITSTLGNWAGSTYGVSKHTGSNVTVDDFYNTIQKKFDQDLWDYSNGSEARVDSIKKKMGDAKVSNDTGWVSKEAIANALMKTGVKVSQLKALPEFALLKLEASGQKLEGFTLVGFNDDHAPLYTAIKDAVSVLKKHGFEKVIYGEFYSMKKGSKVLADYNATTDDIRVFEISSKGEVKAATKTTLHELGHRYYYKFLSKESKALVYGKYIESIREHKKENKEVKFEVGKHYKIQGKDTIYAGVKPVTRAGRKVQPKFEIIGPDGKPNGRFFTFKNEIDAALILNRDAGETEGDSDSSVPHIATSFVPSWYSRTNEREWFAELFSIGQMNNDKEVIDYIKSLK